MKSTITKSLLTLAAFCFTSSALFAEDNIKNEFNPITTGVTSLSITPDARGASMGDLGAATDPDVNSQFWNASKYAFASSQAGVSLSYTPWLRKLVNDIFLANVAGYWKVGGGDNQAVSASLRYFSLGEITSKDYEGAVMSSINPFEMAFDLGYSRKLSESYSMGVVLRYIYSDLGFTDGGSSDRTKGASAFAADISGYFTTYPIIGRNECQWSIGWNISNIGSKVGYSGGNNPAFLPTNLKLGTAFTFPLADYHNLTLSADQYEQALQDWKDMSPITGIFKSFSDAPGGAKEELREINYSLGAEYSYNQQFFLRGGYFHESAYKGNRQYFGFGAGFALNVLKIDAAYMIATAQSSPLDQTLRFTLSFDMDGIKELFGGGR